MQTEQVMANLGAVLQAAGLEFSQVVKTTIYLQDLGDFAAVNAIYGRFFPGIAPARATVQVAGLPKGVGVEIEGIAYGG
jgi:2-iminobutanoate/2-iminopropanoate deaminase